MPIEIDLPEEVEELYVSAAKARQVSVQILIAEVLTAQAPRVESAKFENVSPELIDERGVPVLRTGIPINASIVRETLEAIRNDHELSAIGGFAITRTF